MDGIKLRKYNDHIKLIIYYDIFIIQTLINKLLVIFNNDYCIEELKMKCSTKLFISKHITLNSRKMLFDFKIATFLMLDFYMIYSNTNITIAI